MGVNIDDTLSFNEHVDSVCKASNFYVRALRHILNFISENTAKTIVRSMVDGRLDYCNSVLYGASTTNINKLSPELTGACCSKIETFWPYYANHRWIALAAGKVSNPLQDGSHNIQGVCWQYKNRGVELGAVLYIWHNLFAGTETLSLSVYEPIAIQILAGEGTSPNLGGGGWS